jgi:hypothetical protein
MKDILTGLGLLSKGVFMAVALPLALVFLIGILAWRMAIKAAS